MNNIVPLVKKELRSYFNSPIAYIVVLVFLVFTSVWFFYIEQFFARDTASMRAFFGIIPVTLVILLPALTMRSWAEEKKLGTVELLLTLPYREGEVVFAKFLASFALFVIMIALTIPVSLTVAPLGNFEVGQIIGEYIGVLLLGSAGLAVGLFISAVSTNQITAFIFSLIVLLFITLANQINLVVNLPKWLASFFFYISLDYHFQAFRKGLIDSRDVLYFLLVTVLFLYVNTKVLIFRKWS